MPIKVACKCGQKFSARDSMGGKKVKCPKCNDPLVIPMPGQPTASGTGSTKQRGVSDLLDEVGVQSARSGPVCPDCGADMQPAAVICIECGFNTALGRKMYTEGSNEAAEMAGMTNAQKLMAKAERELEATPIDAASQNFGDGGDAWIIAAVAGLVAATMMVVMVAAIFFMDQLPQSYTVMISLIVAILTSIIGFWWIVIRGFLEHPLHGFILLFSPPLAWFLQIALGIMFGFFGLPGLGSFIGWVVGMSYFYYFSTTRGMIIAEIMYIGGQILAGILAAILIFNS